MGFEPRCGLTFLFLRTPFYLPMLLGGPRKAIETSVAFVTLVLFIHRDPALTPEPQSSSFLLSETIFDKNFVFSSGFSPTPAGLGFFSQQLLTCIPVCNRYSELQGYLGGFPFPF